jgi:hypothetical protein
MRDEAGNETREITSSLGEWMIAGMKAFLGVVKSGKINHTSGDNPNGRSPEPDDQPFEDSVRRHLSELIKHTSLFLKLEHLKDPDKKRHLLNARTLLRQLKIAIVTLRALCPDSSLPHLEDYWTLEAIIARIGEPDDWTPNLADAEILKSLLNDLGGRPEHDPKT